MSDSKTGSGKLRWSLLPWDEVEDIVRAFEHGVNKGYRPNSWRYAADDTRDKYFDALIRHVKAWHSGEVKDPESGLCHLAHAGACVVILLWHQKRTWQDGTNADRKPKQEADR